MNIYIINNKREERFLRQRVSVFDFKKHSKKEVNDLLKTMKEKMKEAEGIGLSANQLGLSCRVFVGRVPSSDGQIKSYAIFNPEITKPSKERTSLMEGCLSVPGLLGIVERPEKITLIGLDKNGKRIKIKAWGILARVFQHETDHLNGIIFIDKAKEVFKDTPEQTTKI
ncbi:MAG: peptide deformylase [Candidatus Paceibacterota bacterium]|jgi:peptide deformylase